ncbi:hypothetical protein L218DRAFT_372715 [Marasmius fiardii PR-910]|nr:hypothetical protein L218DRAFT_372715 [Marasmius fiardii PR-910]
MRGVRTGSAVPITLLSAMSLSFLFGVFTSIRDIGFLCFYSCSEAGSTTLDHPSSVSSVESALASLNRSMISGTDLSQVPTYWCV